jgi:4-carboxymuconolactone decarboxylase
MRAIRLHGAIGVGTATMNHEELLSRLAMNDVSFIEDVLAIESSNVAASGLDPRSHAFTRLGALVAVGATATCYGAQVDAALAAGVTVDEVVGVLVAVAPTVGLTKVSSAAPALALALGFDTDSALEELDRD